MTGLEQKWINIKNFKAPHLHPVKNLFSELNAARTLALYCSASDEAMLLKYCRLNAFRPSPNLTTSFLPPEILLTYKAKKQTKTNVGRKTTTLPQQGRGNKAMFSERLMILQTHSLRDWKP